MTRTKLFALFSKPTIKRLLATGLIALFATIGYTVDPDLAHALVAVAVEIGQDQ